MNQQKVIIEVHPNFAWLVRKMQTQYRYAKITVLVQDGIPQRILSGILNDDPKDDEEIKQ